LGSWVRIPSPAPKIIKKSGDLCCKLVGRFTCEKDRGGVSDSQEAIFRDTAFFETRSCPLTMQSVNPNPSLKGQR
jgi:hypothetical protein